MLDRGTVFKTERNTAYVEFVASSECARCGACARASAGRMTIAAENPIGAKAGDKVEVEISPVVKTLVPFMVFGLPIVSMFLGLALGSFISEKAAIITGLLFLAAGFMIVRRLDKYVAGQKRFRGRIMRKLKEVR